MHTRSKFLQFLVLQQPVYLNTMPSVLSLLCSLLICFSVSNRILTAAAQTNKSEIDRQALLCFKSGVTSDPLSTLSSWQNNSLSFCSWRGVTCGTRLPGRVVSLNLTSSRLGGFISGCIGNLASLYRIDLSDNNLGGNIPESLWSSLSLSYVNLANNTLNGGIPVSLANSYSLKTLILSRNNLSGDIPATLFANSSALIMVDLQMNSLTGSIPTFGKVSGLMFLCLTENFLSGCIPPSIGNISSLTSILLGQNKLSGLIPESLSNIPKLLKLDLSYNILSGHIPLSIYNMSSLEYFSIGSNGLVGHIPSYIGYSLPNLQYLKMQNNKLAGHIPTSVTNTWNLQVFDLSGNLLGGPIPSLGSLASLREVILGNNLLEAHDWLFITSLANCTQLKKLSLEGNILNGSLPRSVVNLSTGLEYLSLGSNHISGSIPVEIDNLANLTLLRMENNLLYGAMPSTIGKLHNLFILDLSRNKLSGQIPPSIGNNTQLGQLYLDGNMLGGNIPSSLGQCLRLLQLNFSSNNLNGGIPEELFTNTPLLGFDLSHNNLTGRLPEVVGQLVLISINVSNNQLFGGVPTSFGKLLCIQQINISRNKLSGAVPTFFEDLRTLEQLDLSYNNFEGPIPTGGCFRNSNIVVLEGNKKLCGSVSMLALPICDGTSATKTKIHAFAKKKKKNHATLLKLVIIPISTVGFLMLLWLMFYLWKERVVEHTFPRCNKMFSISRLRALQKREVLEILQYEQDINNGKEPPAQKRAKAQQEVHACPSGNHKEMLQKVSYGDILRATNCFSSIHAISFTRTGSVYVGRFKSDRSLVAIKVFNLSEPGAYESYFIECEVLRSTRHRNLMRPVTLCSTLDKENHEFKALIFNLMVNGSLGRCLYSEQHYGILARVLSLGERICIAADVASALDYIHNQLTPPLVHCDLKPSNILLDHDMTARLGDFGSAKFLFPGLITPKNLADVGGTIGYMAPEYSMGCEISTGGDVYSFGVLLLEMLTGKQPINDMFVDGLSLCKFVDSMFPDRVAGILDPRMAPEEHQGFPVVWMQSYIVPLVALGLSCSFESPKHRPGMQDVCAKLSAIKDAFLESSG